MAKDDDKTVSREELRAELLQAKIDNIKEMDGKLASPPASLTNYIEAEITKRVEERASHYRTNVYVAVGIAAVALAALGWVASEKIFNDAVGAAAKMIYTGVLNEATNSIEITRSNAVEDGKFISAARARTESNSQNYAIMVEGFTKAVSNYHDQAIQTGELYLSRLAVLRTKDNVVVIDDLPSMIVTEAVTNMVPPLYAFSHDLKYEPIPSTLQLRILNTRFNRSQIWTNIGLVQGSNVTISPSILNQIAMRVRNTNLLIEFQYVKKPTFIPTP